MFPQLSKLLFLLFLFPLTEHFYFHLRSVFGLLVKFLQHFLQQLHPQVVDVLYFLRETRRSKNAHENHITCSLNAHSSLSIASTIARLFFKLSGPVIGGSACSHFLFILALSIKRNSCIPTGRPQPDGKHECKPLAL